jgi:hypothetical protein
MRSLDIDEYVMPSEAGSTLVDQLVKIRQATDRGAYCVEKHNFIATPHTLEPVHLLTIEA